MNVYIVKSDWEKSDTQYLSEGSYSSVDEDEKKVEFEDKVKFNSV